MESLVENQEDIEAEVHKYTTGHGGKRVAEGTEFAGQDVFDSASLRRMAGNTAPKEDVRFPAAPLNPPSAPAAQPDAVTPVPETVDDAMKGLAAAIHRAASMLNAACGGEGGHAYEAPANLPAKTIAFANNGMTSVAMGVQKELEMGPLAPLISDETVNDILVNGPYDIYVERGGKVERTNVVFEDHQSLLDLAQKIVGAVGRKLDPKRPLVDARLLDGSRVNIVAPPLAIDGISMSIRKFARDRITLDRMAEMGNMTPQLAAFLKVVGRAKVNIIICGGTGSGKTTLLNAISQFIGKEERIVTIEDSAELQLQQPHVVRLETKEPESYGKKDEEVSMRDLVKNALRMRPDRIIVGEVRGPEAFDMIQAMNTGHDGSLTTIHANNSTIYG